MTWIRKLGSKPLALIVLVALAGTAAAAVSVTYQTSQAALAVKAAPIVWEAGADASYTDYVPSLVLSTNATSFTLTVRGVPEAPVTISDLIHLKNVDTRVHSVTLSTTQVTNSYVTAYRLDFYDAATLVGTLDLKSANPSLSFVDIPAGKTYVAQATITLASGAGNHNVDDARTIAATVSS